jgi:hypothetical protein
MGNAPSIPELKKKKQILENTIIEYNIVIRKEHVYGAPDRNRVEYLKGEIENMTEELEHINKTLSKQ